ncbi:MAG TPA: PilZ domain-containing protein, partial [Gemmataceae bacterium]|nr:PilZ domain-containing protein [Gemmataceae bacterium]
PMQLLIEWLPGVNVGNAALLLAIGAGLIILLSFLLLGRRPRRTPREFEPPILPGTPAGSGDWESPLLAARHDERRRSTRRSGMPTPILVVDAKGGRHAWDAYVLDRSAGGIRIALEKSCPVGSMLLARPSNAPEGFEWVKVTVKSCREVGDYFEIGCQFENELELSRLLMFG